MCLGWLAQLVEQVTLNHRVGGSSPSPPTYDSKPELYAEINMKPSEIQFALNLEALSAPQCRRIIEALMQGPQSLKELSKVCKLTPGSIEKHLEIIVESGLVKVRTINGIQQAQLQMSKFKPTLDWFSTLSN